MNDLREKVIKGFTCCDGAAVHLGHCQEDCPYFGESERADKCVEKLHSDALSLLKAQEPRVLQIKEVAFLEIAVFIETNGDLEGKGTDLFLAIPYIYAVSQNMLYGYIAFVDGNTDVYDLQAIDYGKLWRCWTSRPTDEQRKAVKWDDI